MGAWISRKCVPELFSTKFSTFSAFLGASTLEFELPIFASLAYSFSFCVVQISLKRRVAPICLNLNFEDKSRNYKLELHVLSLCSLGERREGKRDEQETASR